MPKRKILVKKNGTKRKPYCRGDNVWQIIIASLIGNNGLHLRVRGYNAGAYSRDLLFILVRDYLTQMIEMDRKLHKFRRSETRETLMQKMFKRYGEELVMLWYKVKCCSELNQMNIILKVQQDIKRWKRDDTYTPIQLITTLAWERYKSTIIKNIIEPYLKIRGDHFNQPKRSPPTAVRGTTTESMEATESTIIPPEVTTIALPVSSLLSKTTVVKEEYEKEDNECMESEGTATESLTTESNKKQINPFQKDMAKKVKQFISKCYPFY